MADVRVRVDELRLVREIVDDEGNVIEATEVTVDQAAQVDEAVVNEYVNNIQRKLRSLGSSKWDDITLDEARGIAEQLANLSNAFSLYANRILAPREYNKPLRNL